MYGLFSFISITLAAVINMKISYNWLGQYINVEHSPEETAKLLTDCGLEVEAIETWHP